MKRRQNKTADHCVWLTCPVAPVKNATFGLTEDPSTVAELSFDLLAGGGWPDIF